MVEVIQQAHIQNHHQQQMAVSLIPHQFPVPSIRQKRKDNLGSIQRRNGQQIEYAKAEIDEVKFLFTGDGERLAEEELLNRTNGLLSFIDEGSTVDVAETDKSATLNDPDDELLCADILSLHQALLLVYRLFFY